MKKKLITLLFIFTLFLYGCSQNPWQGNNSPNASKSPTDNNALDSVNDLIDNTNADDKPGITEDDTSETSDKSTSTSKQDVTNQSTEADRQDESSQSAGTDKQDESAQSAETDKQDESTQPTDIDQQDGASNPSEDESTLDEDGEYTLPEDVALFLHTFERLPSNFITKNDARDLGWVSSEGNLWEVTDEKSIGGDKFGNREGLLPKAKGRVYYECDVNYSGGYRGDERIVFSNDGLIFYTDDHYKSFTQLY